jgi:fatty acid desaturase
VNLLLLAGGWTAFALLGRSWWQMLVAVFLGIMFTQTGFIGHDAGHRQISGSRRIDSLIGRIHGNLLIGLSYGWWISKHNRHHAHPNHPGRDPDIAGRAIALTADQSRARRGAGIWLARHQAWLFFPDAPAGRAEPARGRRAGDDPAPRHPGHGGRGWPSGSAHRRISGCGVPGALPPAGVAFIALHQGLFGLYLGSSFAPNHTGMPVFAEDDNVDFLRRQVLTSRNVRGNRLADFTLGGLNYQIEHHLFPSMPRPNLRRAQAPVRAFCAEHGIPYAQTGLLASYAQVLRHLDATGAPSRS